MPVIQPQKTQPFAPAAASAAPDPGTAAPALLAGRWSIKQQPVLVEDILACAAIVDAQSRNAVTALIETTLNISERWLEPVPTRDELMKLTSADFRAICSAIARVIGTGS